MPAGSGKITIGSTPRESEMMSSEWFVRAEGSILGGADEVDDEASRRSARTCWLCTRAQRPALFRLAYVGDRVRLSRLKW